MVTRAYFDGEEPPFRRFNGRGQLYSLSHPERELPPAHHHNPYVGSRNQQTPTNEVRNGESTPEQDTNQHPRRRIPVAVSSSITFIMSSRLIYGPISPQVLRAVLTSLDCSVAAVGSARSVAVEIPVMGSLVRTAKAPAMNIVNS